MRCARTPGRSWIAQGFLCTTSSTLCELPVDAVNLLSAMSASGNFCRSTDPGEQQAGGAATDEETQLRGSSWNPSKQRTRGATIVAIEASAGALSRCFNGTVAYLLLLTYWPVALRLRVRA